MKKPMETLQKNIWRATKQEEELKNTESFHFLELFVNKATCQ